MRKILLLLLLITFLAGCNATSDTTGSSNAKYSYLALGDSYTIGESVPVEKTWPVQLVERLNERGYEVAPPKIVAKTGWTTMNLIRGIESAINVQRDFDLVSILIGVNNQYQDKTLSEFETELNEIFRKAIFHSRQLEKGVFAVSIPDYGATPFGAANAQEIGLEIDEFNAIFRKVAEEYDVDFYNITPISRQGLENPELVANDGLHPSGLMYQYWVDQIIDQVAAKLPEN